MCSYFPNKLVNSMGFDTVLVEYLSCEDCSGAVKLPYNICSYVHNFQRLLGGDGFDGIVLTNCCNAMQRMYDVVRTSLPEKFSFMLEIPIGNSREEYSFFTQSVSKMADAMCSYFSIRYDSSIVSMHTAGQGEGFKDNTVLVLGSAVHPGVREIIINYFSRYNIESMLCSTRENGDELLRLNWMLEANEGLADIVSLYPNIKPCPRMNYFFDWFEQLLEKNAQRIKGIIYIVSQKCDNGLFAYPVVKKYCDSFEIPVLFIEEEFRKPGHGQYTIKLEAFLESLDFRDKKRNGA